MESVAELDAPAAVLPIGSYEQHGPALPLATDNLVACLIAERICRDYGLLSLPPITISCSHEHSGFAGTVSISSRTLVSIVEDILESLRSSGMEKLVIVNAHGGNHVLGNVAQEANRRGRRLAVFPGSADWHDARRNADLATNAHDDMHAGELETSILLYGAPAFVRPDYGAYDHDGGDRALFDVMGMAGYTESGVIGFPSLATAEKGKALLDSLSRSFDRHLKALREE